MTRRPRKIFFWAMIFWTLILANANARQITDMTGRTVEVPEVIGKVFGTSPPATLMIYTMDPGMVAGLNFRLSAAAKPYLDPRIAELPIIGGWFGQGHVCNLETLLQKRPDVILAWMWQNLSATNEKMEQTLKPLGIPLVYIRMETLNDYPAAFRFLGELFNRPERGRALSVYTEQTLEEIRRMRAALPEGRRVSVYYAEGADGLSTECHTSIHARLIPLSGGRNVYRCNDESTRGMRKISMEQVVQYNPQVIVSHEPLFYDTVATHPKWRNIRAVKDGRVYPIPRIPFNWFDRPPSFMRLIGLKWMMTRLYPDTVSIDMIAEMRHFYRLFLNVELDEPTAEKILHP